MAGSRVLSMAVLSVSVFAVAEYSIVWIHLLFLICYKQCFSEWTFTRSKSICRINFKIYLQNQRVKAHEIFTHIIKLSSLEAVPIFYFSPSMSESATHMSHLHFIYEESKTWKMHTYLIIFRLGLRFVPCYNLFIWYLSNSY